MNANRAWGLLGIAILLLGIAVWMSRRSPESDRDDRHVEPERTSTPSVAPTEVALATPGTAEAGVGSGGDPGRAAGQSLFQPEGPAPQGEVPGSVGEFAAGFYGDEWLDVRPELAKRIQLSMAAHVPIPPVENVLDELLRRMMVRDSVFERWKLRYMPPDPVDLEYLRRKYSDALDLDADALARLESRLIDDRAEILADLQQLRAVCDAALRRKWALRHYDFGPFAALRTQHVPARAFHADSTGIDSWSFSWGLAEDEDPEFPRLLRSLEAAAKRVAATIRTFLAESK